MASRRPALDEDIAIQPRRLAADLRHLVIHFGEDKIQSLEIPKLRLFLENENVHGPFVGPVPVGTPRDIVICEAEHVIHLAVLEAAASPHLHQLVVG